MRTILSFFALLPLLACGGAPAAPSPDGGDCGCGAPSEPWTDVATLRAYTTGTDFLGSVLSFRWATTVDEGEVRNDWDLSLTSDVTSADALAFRVNLVTDDQSCIEDEGPIAIAQVPARVTRCDDNVRVVPGHVYLVKNVDPDEQQYAAFAVLSREQNAVTLRWFRSPAADHFTFEH